MSLDDAIDELYGADLDEFVAERARLAKALRDGGDRAAAQSVAKLRKPTVAAWALNQLARRDRHEVDLLLDAGHRLREAQAGALEGADREAFEQARRTERDARSHLVRATRELLEERGRASAATLDQVAESLRSAAISEEGRELLARGRFVQPLHAQGFDLVGELAASIAPTAAAGQPARAAEREAERQARQALKDAKEELRAAEREARDAEREAQRRRTEAEKAERDAAAARARAEDAAGAVEDAERRVEELRRR